MSKERSSDKNSDLLNRNKKLLGLFSSNGYNVRVIGKNEPMVVLDDRYIIPCFINNFTLHFLKSLGSDEILKSVNLKKEIYLTKFELDEIISRCELLPAYRIKLKGLGLDLVGYNYLENNEGIFIEKYPVFAKYQPYFYFEYDKAEKVYNDLLQQGYDVEIDNS